MKKARYGTTCTAAAGSHLARMPCVTFTMCIYRVDGNCAAFIDADASDRA